MKLIFLTLIQAAAYLAACPDNQHEVITRPFDKHNLDGIVGKHIVYTYDSGWKYDNYVKNQNTLDYRVHSGTVANRWVKDQSVYIVRVGENVYKISWTEPTGTDVSLLINLGENVFHGTIFFPRWVENNPEKIAVFQNEHLEEMIRYRDAGPTYPIKVIDNFATITVIQDCGINNEDVIASAPSELPADFPYNLKNCSLMFAL